MTVASCEVDLQSKHDLICHSAKVKPAKPEHSMAAQYLHSVFIIPQNGFLGWGTLS